MQTELRSSQSAFPADRNTSLETNPDSSVLLHRLASSVQRCLPLKAVVFGNRTRKMCWWGLHSVLEQHQRSEAGMVCFLFFNTIRDENPGLVLDGRRREENLVSLLWLLF